MKRLILLVITISSVCLSSAQTVSKLNTKIDSISRVVLSHDASLSCFDLKVETLRDCYDRQGDVISKNNDAICTALEAGNRSYNIFSILIAGLGAIFTLMGVGLGIYIRSKEQKVANLLTKVKESEAEVEQKTSEVESALGCVEAMKAQVENLNSLIQKDLNGLYTKLRREETVYLLDRLITVPLDIGNLSNLLLSRELQDDDYDKLLRAYNILVANNEQLTKIDYGGNTAADGYLLIFFQYYLGKSINEDSICSGIVYFFAKGCNRAFKNDIIKSTKDLLQGISAWEDNDKIDVLAEYIQGVTYYGKGGLIQKDYQFVYDIIIKLLNNENLIIEVWNKIIKKEVRIDSFALALKNYYNKADITSKIDDDINSLPRIVKIKHYE